MTITQEVVDARKNEVNRIFKENLGAVIADKFQFYRGVCVSDEAYEEKSEEKYPLIAEVSIDTVVPMDTWDVNLALGSGGTDDVIDWLVGLGVVDGTVDVRINSIQENDGL